MSSNSIKSESLFNSILVTVSIQLNPDETDKRKLEELRRETVNGCNLTVPIVRKERTYNRVELHHLCYDMLRSKTKLGSQMCCNVVRQVSAAYKSQAELNKKGDVFAKKIDFRRNGSVHYDKRTYTIYDVNKDDFKISLNTLNKNERIILQVKLNKYYRDVLEPYLVKNKKTDLVDASPTSSEQEKIDPVSNTPGDEVSISSEQVKKELSQPKEAQLVLRNGYWYFNLVIEHPKVEPIIPIKSGKVKGIDLGENNLAADSRSGKIYGGGNLRHERDKHLALRSRLQIRNTQSAKQKLKKLSGTERRRVTHENHKISKDIVKDAADNNVSVIVLENLTNIRKRIKAGKRVRTRLHRWAWRQLQLFIRYKANAVGILVIFVNPAYTSQDCSRCGSRGRRNKHNFVCNKCGLTEHADLNASRNLAKIGQKKVLKM
jgi:IS605 OrfB family transposase